jgi:exopolysaccharide biosynthesis glucuronosyltransferase PssE
MIFVSVGTNEARFDRLLRAVGELSIDEELIIQHGHSSAIGPPSAELVDFLSFDAMVQTMRRARVVLTHAGVGSIMVALAQDKRPVVVPRRKAFHEAVDDHQLELGRRFAAAGIVTFVESPDDLGTVLEAQHAPATITPGLNSLGHDLRDFVALTVAAAPRRRRA